MTTMTTMPDLHSNNFIDNVISIKPFIGSIINHTLHIHQTFESVIPVLAAIDDLFGNFSVLNLSGVIRDNLPYLPNLKYFVIQGLHRANDSNVWAVFCGLDRFPEYAINFGSSMVEWVQISISPSNWELRYTNSYYVLELFVDQVRVLHERWENGGLPLMDRIRIVNSPILDQLTRDSNNWALKERLLSLRMESISKETVSDFSRDAVLSLPKIERVELSNVAWKGMQTFLEGQIRL